MATDSEKRQRLETINRLLASGVKSDTNDGHSTTIDHETLRRERDRLERELQLDSSRPQIFRFGR